MAVEQETAMWNPPESEYILLDRWQEFVHEFKARGFQQAFIEKKKIEEELQDSTVLYIKVANQ